MSLMLEMFRSVSCHVSYVPDYSKGGRNKLARCLRQDRTYRAPIALLRASKWSTGAGVFAFGVATLAGFVVLAMIRGDSRGACV